MNKIVHTAESYNYLQVPDTSLAVVLTAWHVYCVLYTAPIFKLLLHVQLDLVDIL
jgi:hypothetical protein